MTSYLMTAIIPVFYWDGHCFYKQNMLLHNNPKTMEYHTCIFLNERYTWI